MVRLIVSSFLLIFMAMSAYAVDTANNIHLNLTTINHLTKQKGKFDSATNVYRIVVPRDDLDILVNGMRIPPDLLTSWVSFGKAEDLTTVVGDLILLQDQVNPVMTVALKNGLEVTDLHNPFLWESPRVMLLHIKGIGDEKKLASAVGKVFDEIHRTMNGNGDFPLTNADFSENKLNPNKLRTVLGVKPSHTLGAYKVVLSPDDKSPAADNPNQAQIHIWAAFTGSDSEAMVDGNIALRPGNLQSVLTMLRNSHVYVLSIYQHTIENDPNYIFIHYWGLGRSDSLAKVLHKVMAETKKIESPYNFKTELALSNYAKKLTKDLYPEFTMAAATPTSAPIPAAKHTMPRLEQAKEFSRKRSTTDYVKIFTLGVSSALLTAQEKMYGYTKSVAANVAYAMVVAYSVTHKQTAPVVAQVSQAQKVIPRSPAVTVKVVESNVTVKATESMKDNMSLNTKLLSRDVSKSMNIPQAQAATPGLSYSLLPQPLIAQVQTYLYANPITQPVIQSEKSQPTVTQPVQSENDSASVNADVLAKELSKIMYIDDQRYTQAEISNEFLRQVLATQSKNYSYWNVIIKPLPIPVAVDEQATVAESKPANDNASVNSIILVNKLSQAMAIDNQAEISNDFLRQLLAAQSKNYSYWNVIIKPLPIPVNAEVPQTVAETKTVDEGISINSQVIIDKLSVAMAIDPRQYKKNDVSSFFLRQLLSKYNKDYSYASLIIKPLPPVALEPIKPTATLLRQLASAMSVNTNQYAQLQITNELLYKLLMTQNKSYSYSHLIIRPLPAATLEQETVVQMASSELLAKKVSHAIYMRYRPYAQVAMTNPLLHDLLVAQNKNYTYKKLIIWPMPAVQEEVVQSQVSVAQNSSPNIDTLAKRLSKTLYMASNERVTSSSEFLQVLLVAQNKDYSYSKIFNKALSTSDDAEQSTKKAQAEVKKLAVVAPAIVVSPIKSIVAAQVSVKPSVLVTPPMNITLKPVMTIVPNSPVTPQSLQTVVNSNVIPVLAKHVNTQVNAKPLIYAEHASKARTADEMETRIKPSTLKNHSVKVDVIPLSAFGQTVQHAKVVAVTQLAANTVSQKPQLNNVKPLALAQNPMNVTVKPVLKINTVEQKHIKPTVLAANSVTKPVIPVESKRIVIKPKMLTQHSPVLKAPSSTPVVLAKNNQDAKAKQLLKEMSDSDYINQYKKQIHNNHATAHKNTKHDMNSEYARLTEPHDYVPKHTKSMSGRRIDALWDNASTQHTAPVVAQHKPYQAPADLAQQNEAPTRGRPAVDDYTSSYEWQ